MTNPHERLKHHVTGAVERGEAQAIVEVPARPAMTAYLAIGIWDGFEEPIDREQVIEAARFIRDHGPRGILMGNGTRDAIALANAADDGTLDDE